MHQEPGNGSAALSAQAERLAHELAIYRRMYHHLLDAHKHAVRELSRWPRLSGTLRLLLELQRAEKFCEELYISGGAETPPQV